VKILLILFVLVFTVFAQQINHDWGMSTTGVRNSVPVKTDIDTTATSGWTVVFDIADYYPFDIFPYKDTSGVALLNSDRATFGTLRTYFDVQNAADSAIYTIKLYEGMYSNADKSPASIKYEETAVTLRTVRSVDAFFQDNVYFGSTAYKQYPPEVFKIVIAKVAEDTDCDDSTDVYIDYAYPAIYQQYKERKLDTNVDQRNY
jgi:hypothetical protein